LQICCEKFDYFKNLLYLCGVKGNYKRYMEDVVLKMPSADVALIMQFANRMGWMIESRRNPVARFIEACSKSNADALTDEEIQAEINAVRYDK